MNWSLLARPFVEECFPSGAQLVLPADFRAEARAQDLSSQWGVGSGVPRMTALMLDAASDVTRDGYKVRLPRLREPSRGEGVRLFCNPSGSRHNS
jgi:hypothetical protein